MALQRGPLLLQSDSEVNIEPGVYDFEADAQKLAGSLNGIGAGWDGSLLAIENFASEPIDELLQLDFESIAAEISTQGVIGSLPYLDEIDAGYTDAGSNLQDAIAFAPAQAWSDPGPAFTPPTSALTLAKPSIDPGAFHPAQNFTVGQNTGGKNPALGLFNTTRFGATDFTVGDSWEVVGLGKLGDHVEVVSTFNGQDLPPVDYGPMDSSGQFFLTGVMGPENVGAWNENWLIRGALVASFNFLVTPGT